MQKIKIARKEMKETGKGNTMVAVFDEKNVRFSGFLPELKDVLEGDTIEAEIEVDGKYNNIKAIKILSHGEAPDKVATKSYSQDSPEKRRSIERQTAAQIAFANMVQPQSLRDACLRAEAIYQWIAKGTIPEPSTAQTGDKIPAKTEPPPPVATDTKETTKQESIEGVDLPIVKESIHKIGWDKGKTPPWRSWLRSKANYTGLNLEGTLEEVLTRMDRTQKEFFIKEIQSRVDLS